MTQAVTPELLASAVERIQHVLSVVANYSDAVRNGGEFADKHREDLEAMNGDVIAEDAAAIAAWNTRIASASAPAGWKLVPVALTREMYEAGEVECRLQHGACKVWSAMLTAAPQPPVVGERRARAIAQQVVPYDGHASYVSQAQRDRRSAAKAAARIALAQPAEVDLMSALEASLAKRSQPTMDPPYTAAFNAALDMVAKDTADARAALKESRDDR